MKFRLTLSLSFLFVIMCAIAYWEDQKTADETHALTHQTQLFDMPLREIRKIQLRLSDKSWTIEKDSDHWVMRHPHFLTLDEDLVSAFLEQILTFRGQKEISASNESWKDYGLDEDKSYLTIWNANGVKQTLYVGDSSPTGYQTYVASSLQDKVFLGSEYMRLVLNKKPTDFRSHKIIHWEGSDWISLRLKMSKSKEEYLLEHKGSQYLSNGKEIDAGKVEDFLYGLNSLSPTDFYDPPYPPDFEGLFADERISYVLTWKTPWKEEIMQVAFHDDHLVVRLQDSPTVFALDLREAKKFVLIPSS